MKFADKRCLWAVVIVTLCGLGGLLAGCSKDESTPALGKKADQRAPDQILQQSEILMVEGGRTTAVIEADYLEKFFADDLTKADRIKAFFYDSAGTETSQLVADSGEVREQSNQMIVWGHVKVTSAEGMILTTQSLRWNQRTNKVVTDDYVEIHRGADLYTGYGLETDRTLKNFKIKRLSGRIEKLPGDSQ